MASFTLRGIDDHFWYRVKVDALRRRKTIKKLILDLLEGSVSADIDGDQKKRGGKK